MGGHSFLLLVALGFFLFFGLGHVALRDSSNTAGTHARARARMRSSGVDGQVQPYLNFGHPVLKLLHHAHVHLHQQSQILVRNDLHSCACLPAAVC